MNGNEKLLYLFKIKTHSCPFRSDEHKNSPAEAGLHLFYLYIAMYGPWASSISSTIFAISSMLSSAAA